MTQAMSEEMVRFEMACDALNLKSILAASRGRKHDFVAADEARAAVLALHAAALARAEEAEKRAREWELHHDKQVRIKQRIHGWLNEALAERPAEPPVGVRSEREAFEQDASLKNVDIRKDSAGDYMSHATEAAWWGWQTALASRPTGEKSA